MKVEQEIWLRAYLAAVRNVTWSTPGLKAKLAVAAFRDAFPKSDCEAEVPTLVLHLTE